MKPKLHHSDLAVVEDELKPEYDVLNNFVKKMSSMKEKSQKLSDENQALKDAIKSMKAELIGEQKSFSSFT